MTHDTAMNQTRVITERLIEEGTKARAYFQIWQVLNNRAYPVYAKTTEHWEFADFFHAAIRRVLDPSLKKRVWWSADRCSGPGKASICPLATGSSRAGIEERPRHMRLRLYGASPFSALDFTQVTRLRNLGCRGSAAVISTNLLVGGLDFS